MPGQLSATTGGSQVSAREGGSFLRAFHDRGLTTASQPATAHTNLQHDPASHTNVHILIIACRELGA